MAIAPIGPHAAMLSGLPPIGTGLPAAGVAPAQAPIAGRSFEATLTQAVERVNGEQLQARDALAGLASGDNVDIHGTMIALERAEISMRAMTSVRDKLVGAYEQIMNMAL